MSGPGEQPFIEHVPPTEFPQNALVAIAIPSDFNKVIVASSGKNGVGYAEQLLTWAMKGAEHERLCEPKTAKSGRKNRK